MKLNKTIIFSLAIVQAVSSFASGVENTMVKGMEQNLGEVIKDVAEGLLSAAPLLEAVATGVQVMSIGKDVVSGAQAVHSHFRPTEAQQAADFKTRKALEFFKSAQSYRTCMVGNAKAPSRTSSGFPSSCSVFEQAYAMTGGRKEVDEMKQSFKKYDTGSSCSTKDDNSYSTTQKVLMGGAVGVVVVGVAVVAAPYVLPASTYAAAQAAAATVSAKASAAVAAGATKASAAVASSSAITQAQAVVEVTKLTNTLVRHVCPSEEQQVQQLSHQRSIQRSFSGEIKEAFAKK